MTLAKSPQNSRIAFVHKKPNIRKTQVVIFGAIISTLASASAIGYIAYISNPFVQEYFLKFIYR